MQYIHVYDEYVGLLDKAEKKHLQKEHKSLYMYIPFKDLIASNIVDHSYN